MRKSPRGIWRIFLAGLLILAMPCAVRAAGARCEVTILNLPAVDRDALEQRLKDASPSDSVKFLLAALALPETKVEAVAAVPAESGFRVKAAGRVLVEVTVTILGSQPEITIDATVAFGQQTAALENAVFRSGEVKLVPLSDSTFAAVRVIRTAD